MDTGSRTLAPFLRPETPAGRWLASYDRAVVLSDGAIRRLIEAGSIGIDPYEPGLLQPSSLDVRVDRLFRVFRNSRHPYIDVKQAQEELTELVEVDGDEPFILHPGEFVLGSTLERVTLPDDLVARLEGEVVAWPARAADPLDRRVHRSGWDGHVTLELSNVANLPITIYPEMKIGQLSFVQMSEAAEKPYGSGRSRLEVPGPARPDAEPLLEELHGRMSLAGRALATHGNAPALAAVLRESVATSTCSSTQATLRGPLEGTSHDYAYEGRIELVRGNADRAVLELADGTRAEPTEREQWMTAHHDVEALAFPVRSPKRGGHVAGLGVVRTPRSRAAHES